MNKEDVIETLERFVLGVKPSSQIEIVDACASAYRMLKEQPSLPSNLDEAAEKYSNTPYNFGEFAEIEYEFGEPIETVADDKVFVKNAFKAGAEWMAGQGEKIEGYIAGVHDVAAILAIPRKEHNKGDNVVVQIRKK